MRVLRKFFRAVLSDFLIWIPISALPVMIIIFVTNVLMHMELSFLLCWKWSYLILFGINIGLDLFWLIWKYFEFRQTAKRLGRSYSQIEEAVLVFKLNKSKPVKDWTNEWLTSRLAIREISVELTKSIMKSFRS